MRLAVHRSVIASIVFLLFGFVGSASAQIRTVLVSPVPGNPVASGTALRNAIAGIAAPSSTNRWLVKVEPGIYDVGTVSLPMRSWVDVEGSGIDATTIQGSVDASTLSAGTINGASNTELRLVTVIATRTPSTSNVIAMYNETATSLRFYRVRFVAQSTSGAFVWAMRNAASAPLIEECEFSSTITGTTTTSIAYGIVFYSSVPGSQRSSILRSKILVTGATLNYGVYMVEAQTLTEIRNTKIDVLGGSNTYGVYATGPSWQGTEVLAIRDTEVSSAGASSASYGLSFQGGTTVVLEVFSSKIWGHVAPTTYGVRQQGNAPVGIQGSSIVGFTNTVESISSVSISSTGLTGGAVSVFGWVGCMGVWDENGVFYANSCP